MDPETDENALTTVAYAYSTWEVSCICAPFEAAGLEVFLRDQALCRMVPHYTVAVGGVRVRVRARDMDAALNLLTSMVEHRGRRRFRPFWSGFVLVGFLLFGVPAHFGPGLYVRYSNSPEFQ